MPTLATRSKIQEFFDNEVLSELKNWNDQLVDGDLLGFEQGLQARLKDLHNKVCEELLTQSAEQVFDGLKEESSRQGSRKITKRSLSIRIATGRTVKVPSPYVKQPPDGCTDERHLLARHWNLIGGASPKLYDQVGFCTAIAPSFESGCQILSKFGTAICVSSTQKLSQQLAAKCQAVGEAKLSLDSNESVADKTVVIGVDGGRTRTREYTGHLNKAGHACYETPWREPKLFVIDIINELGRVDRKELPIYGTRFNQQDLFGLLGTYLQRLGIQQAKRVQIVGDGAPWIWNNLRPILVQLGVSEDRITETLDVWHSSQYVHKLIDNLGTRKTAPEKRKLKHQFEHWLWNGQSNKIVELCKAIFKRQNDTVRRCITYLDTHVKRMQYPDFKQLGLMCGSGIVESAIRRVINLRFKNSATFWYDDNVEKMYFLRAAVLSKRWDTVIQNLQL
ncbi:MAG: hypothetical protein AAGJ82_11160 [Bacteroidota bacterium]